MVRVRYTSAREKTYVQVVEDRRGRVKVLRSFGQKTFSSVAQARAFESCHRAMNAWISEMLDWGEVDSEQRIANTIGVAMKTFQPILGAPVVLSLLAENFEISHEQMGIAKQIWGVKE